MINCPIEDEAWIVYRDLELLRERNPQADIEDLFLEMLGRPHIPILSLTSTPRTKEKPNE